MKGVLDALEQLHEPTYPQGRRLAHGLVEKVMESKHCTEVVADGIGQEESL